LSKDGRVLKTMHPEKRQYFSSQMPMTEAAIDAGFTRDVYVSLGEAARQLRRMERARLLQALRRLDLGRLPADGGGWFPCSV
jgi:cytochrome c biogenesis factor